jgi:hypothetical protein
MQLGNSDNILIEEEERWQKVIMPAEKSTFLFIFYSIAMILWAISTIWIIYQIFQPLGIDRPFMTKAIYRLIWFGLLVTWYWFAKNFLWGFWQYYAANREILFINEEEFIIRRPVSLLGVTNVYDMKHIEAIYHDEEKDSPTLQYGVQPVHFGQALSTKEGIELISMLTHRHFSHLEDDEEF